MALFDNNESIFELELGKTLRIPCKFVKGKSSHHSALVKNLAKQMEQTKQNLLPIIVKLLGEDNYEAIQNIQILEAARLAQLDFVWCIVVNENMLRQVLVESGEKIYLEIQTVSPKELIEVLDYFKNKIPHVSKIDSLKAAKAIVEQREKTKINNLNFLTKKSCGIGKASLSKIQNLLVFK